MTIALIGILIMLHFAGTKAINHLIFFFEEKDIYINEDTQKYCVSKHIKLSFSSLKTYTADICTKYVNSEISKSDFTMRFDRIGVNDEWMKFFRKQISTIVEERLTHNHNGAITLEEIYNMINYPDL